MKWKCNLCPRLRHVRCRGVSCGARYEGEFRDDKQHGHGIVTVASDDKYVGEWRNGVPCGQGKRVYKSGHSVLACWLDSNGFEGETYYNFGDGTCYTG